MNDEKPDTQSTEEPAISDQQFQMALDSLRSEQNFLVGSLAGLAASMLGAGIWAAVTALTEYQIGWMAVGIGVLVGYSIRVAGKGIDQTFGIAGAALSLIGCVVGNILTITYYISINQEMAFMDIFAQLNPGIMYEMLTSSFEIMDILFYGLAGYFGYRYAFRPVSEDDFNRVLGRAT